MEVIYFLAVVFIVWLVSKQIEQHIASKKPENIIAAHEQQAEHWRKWITDDIGKDDLFAPRPDVLVALYKIDSWYNRISQVDKHNKNEAVIDASEFEDAVSYIEDIHSYNQACIADVDESEIRKVNGSIEKLKEIEKKWAKKLGEDVEKYWEEKDEAIDQYFRDKYKTSH